MKWIHTAVVAILAIAFVIFALQNLQSVTVAFLSFGITLPLAVMFFVIYLLGMATGGSARTLMRWAFRGPTHPSASRD
jgi:lipopolysaccharide assembly protein A